MSIKTAYVSVDGPHLRFVGRTGSGHRIVLDDVAGDTGPRPAELVTLALAGCTSMDVISILRKKRQDIARYEVHVIGVQQEEPPCVFTRMDVTHEIEGTDVEVEAVRRAIELSATRYCAVGTTLASGVTEIHHAYQLTDEHGVKHSGEVVVIGPHGRVEMMVPVSTG
jgi:putative redox protein